MLCINEMLFSIELNGAIEGDQPLSEWCVVKGAGLGKESSSEAGSCDIAGRKTKQTCYQRQERAHAAILIHLK